ncbi:hypothetical protein CQ017_09815 [Arthrobacter sp. MYb224]|uniref:HipA domain-containing protein n=1 Tax=Arthrobacter sp. MYb224 TaxID=1848600 RepID=UPI000CFBAAF5|nr:HipA domain-containing protein [Arthrobacter sp. MYb224]PQZ98821.1 hypothetical protein CQ017_09815 [Arthrobacter sp. MYb224]
MADPQLALWFDGVHTATITDHGFGTISLQYTPEAQNSSALLSTKLPIREEPYAWVECVHFLDGLLPEDDVRKMLADKARIPHDDTFMMLGAYGKDCAGAVQVLPLGEEPNNEPHEILWTTDEELATAIASLPTAPLGIGIDSSIRVSLGGLQGKLLVVRDGPRIGMPLDGSPTTHILKPARLNEDGTEQWPSIAELELFGLRLVEASVRLSRSKRQIAAAAEAITVQGRKAILVERYDRDAQSKPVRRIHQEDFCQALGMKQKYQKPAENSPTLKLIAQVLTDNASNPPQERELLLKYLTVNLALGNCDMHARNIGLTIDHGTVRLAPAYDVVPTAAWAHADRELSLHVGAGAHIDEVNGRHLMDEAASWGVPSKIAARQIRTVLGEMLDALPALIEQSRAEGWFTPMILDVADDTRKRIGRLTPPSA